MGLKLVTMRSFSASVTAILLLALHCAASTNDTPDDPTTAAAMRWLRENQMPMDEPNEQSYFDGGIAVPSVNISIQARQTFAFASKVPMDVWRDAVLPFAVTNEARTNWRQLLWPPISQWLQSRVNESTTLAEAATLINDWVWGGISPHGLSKPVVFK